MITTRSCRLNSRIVPYLAPIPAARIYGGRFHRADDPSLDASAFALRDAPEDGHHQFVDVGVRVDPAADVRHPQVHPEVLKNGEGVAELGPVKGALRLADDHRVEGAPGCCDGFQEPCRLRAPPPGKGSAVADV